MEIIKILSWVASIMLIAAFIPQIWRIHIHKEVRDLSSLSFWGLMLGSGGLAVEAFLVGSGPLLFKQLATALCAGVILWQIKVHSKDRWEE